MKYLMVRFDESTNRWEYNKKDDTGWHTVGWSYSIKDGVRTDGLVQILYEFFGAHTATEAQDIMRIGILAIDFNTMISMERES